MWAPALQMILQCAERREIYSARFISASFIIKKKKKKKKFTYNTISFFVKPLKISPVYVSSFPEEQK